MAVRVYDAFADWVKDAVLSLHQAHPEQIRFDGRTAEGNRKVFAKFRYGGSVWKVHGDTHFAPVLRAYEFVCRQPDADPFVIERAGTCSCLNLLPALQEKPKHFYVYENKSSN